MPPSNVLSIPRNMVKRNAPFRVFLKKSVECKFKNIRQVYLISG